MAKKNIEGRQEEYEALKGIPGMDPEDILRQLNGENKPPVTPPTPGTLPTPGTVPPIPAGIPPVPKSGEPAPLADATGILKEIFGDQFTSVEDVKKANIVGKLKEYDTLREQNQTLSREKEELTGKLSTKPKNNFANDDIALYNEFFKATNIKSFDVFNQLNGADVANMDYMNALVLQRMIDNPTLAGQDARVRKYIEKKYNVDPEQITDEEELEVNKIGLAEDGARAKQKLLELKGKLKLPEPEPELPGASLKWTPEIEAKNKTAWGTVSDSMGTQLAAIGIPMKGTKEPIVNFAIPEEARKAIVKNAADYAVSNRMEVDKDNITAVAKYMYSELILQNLDQIAHSIFEKARSMTQEEALKLYHNPSPLGGDNVPPANRGDVLDDDAKRQKVLDAEMGRV
jgi:hypothetical protein